jgi:hypothetical protein
LTATETVIKRCKLWKCVGTQVLRTQLSDIITLDYRRISGKGIISGSSFKIPSLADAHACFGSTPTDQARVCLTSPSPTACHTQSACWDRFSSHLQLVLRIADTLTSYLQPGKEHSVASTWFAGARGLLVKRIPYTPTSKAYTHQATCCGIHSNCGCNGI